jgi:hypothetical protein
MIDLLVTNRRLKEMTVFVNPGMEVEGTRYHDGKL